MYTEKNILYVILCFYLSITLIILTENLYSTYTYLLKTKLTSFGRLTIIKSLTLKITSIKNFKYYDIKIVFLIFAVLY